MTEPPTSASGSVCEPAASRRFVTLTGVDRWDRLARLVTQRRAYLGWSIAQLSAVSGLSTSTVDSLEHSRKTSYDPATIATLERALDWEPGSVDRILKGLSPVPFQDPDLQAVIAAWSKLSPGSRRMLRILATEGARAE